MARRARAQAVAVGLRDEPVTKTLGVGDHHVGDLVEAAPLVDDAGASGSVPMRGGADWCQPKPGISSKSRTRGRARRGERLDGAGAIELKDRPRLGGNPVAEDGQRQARVVGLQVGVELDPVRLARQVVGGDSPDRTAAEPGAGVFGRRRAPARLPPARDGAPRSPRPSPVPGSTSHRGGSRAPDRSRRTRGNGAAGPSGPGWRRDPHRRGRSRACGDGASGSCRPGPEPLPRPSGWPGPAEARRSRGVPMRVRRQHHGGGARAVLAALGVDPFDPARPRLSRPRADRTPASRPAPVEQDPSHPGAGPQSRPRRQRPPPVGHVDARLGRRADTP